MPRKGSVMIDTVPLPEAGKARGEKQFRLSARQAVKIAELHLKGFSFLPEWKGATPVNVYQLFSPDDKNKVSYFEIKVSTPNKHDAGYIIVSASEEDQPIPVFATFGRSHAERLKLKSSHRARKIIWHGPTYSTAEDDKGRIVAAVGQKPTRIISDRKRRGKKKLSGSKKPTNQKAITLPPPKEKKSPKEAWRRIKKYLGSIKEQDAPPAGVAAGSEVFKSIGGTGGDSGIPPSEFPVEVFGVNSALGWERSPNLDQIPANTAPNNNDYSSGCGPTAWAALVSYHNMHWDPDILYGSNYFMCAYINRLIMIFHDKLGTSSLSGQGFTDLEDMLKGYEVVKSYLHHGENYDIEWYAWSEGAFLGFGNETIVDYAKQMIYAEEHPAIIGYRTDTANGHYALGLRYAIPPFDLPEIGYLDYILVDNLHGNGSEDLKWISVGYIFAAYAIPRFTYICPRKRALVDSSLYPMDMASLNEWIYTAWTNKRGKVCISRAPATGYPIPVSGQNPLPIEFGNTKTLEGFKPAGMVSICTWNYTVTYWREFLLRASLMARMSKKPLPVSYGTPWGTEEFIGKRLRGEYSFLSTKQDPYLFLTWRDAEGRIHIAFTGIPGGLEKGSFADYILPERFKTAIDPAIAIAEDQNTGPMLYIAYGSGQGYLVIVELAALFRMAVGERGGWPEDYVLDQWPEEFGSDIATTVEYVENVLGDSVPVEKVVRFTKAWFPITTRGTSHVCLDSNKKEVALVWVENYGYGAEVCLRCGYTFRGNWESCQISMPSLTGESVSSLSTHDRPDIIYDKNGNKLLTWTDIDRRIYIAKISSNQARVIADLLETTPSGPSLHFVTDQLNNKNIILGWFGTDANNSMNHRVLFLSPGWISEDDALPY